MEEAQPDSVAAFTSALLQDAEEAASPSSPSSLYTYEQERILFWMGKPTAIIGILGSFYICFCVARDAKRRQQTFRRLLFAVSAGHIVLILCMALLSIPMPSGVEANGQEHYYYASFGNEQSCKATAFVTQWAFGFTLFHHASMGFYVSTILYETSRLPQS